MIFIKDKIVQKEDNHCGKLTFRITLLNRSSKTAREVYNICLSTGVNRHKYWNLFDKDSMLAPRWIQSVLVASIHEVLGCVTWLGQFWWTLTSSGCHYVAYVLKAKMCSCCHVFHSWWPQVSTRITIRCILWHRFSRMFGLFCRVNFHLNRR